MPRAILSFIESEQFMDFLGGRQGKVGQFAAEGMAIVGRAVENSGSKRACFSDGGPSARKSVSGPDVTEILGSLERNAGTVYAGRSIPNVAVVGSAGPGQY